MAARGGRGRLQTTFAHGTVQSRLADAQEPGRLAGADEARPPAGQLAGILSNEKAAMAAGSHHRRLQQAPRDSAQDRRAADAETLG